MKALAAFALVGSPVLTGFREPVSGDKTSSTPAPGFSSRFGLRTATYEFECEMPGRETVPMKFTATFEYGLDEMQSYYRRWSHEVVERNGSAYYDRFIGGDGFSDDLAGIALELSRLAAAHSRPRVEVALDFVQSLPYQGGMGSYQRYAVETMIDGRGDCSDTAVLLAAILTTWGEDVILIDLPGHLAVGLASCAEPSGKYWYWTRQGKRYYFCESTGYGWDIGECPEEYQNATATLVPVARPVTKRGYFGSLGA